jgi:hypothetical protein
MTSNIDQRLRQIDELILSNTARGLHENALQLEVKYMDLYKLFL